jgi:hypothetical protein
VACLRGDDRRAVQDTAEIRCREQAAISPGRKRIDARVKGDASARARFSRATGYPDQSGISLRKPGRGEQHDVAGFHRP